MGHLCVVAVVGVAGAAAVKITHVLLQGPDVLNETDRDWWETGGELI